MKKIILTLVVIAGIILFPLSAFCADGPENILTDPDYDLLSVDAATLDRFYATIVDIPDRSLKAALWDHLGMTGGEITVFQMMYNLPDTLEISHLDIKDLKGLEYAVNVKKIYAGNNLISFPEQVEPIKDLYNLEVLDLSRNQLTELPSYLFDMPSLRSLNLSDNAIDTAESFDGENVLQELYLENNLLTSLPDMTSLNELVTLSVSGNKLESFPEGIASLGKLTALAIADNNLTVLPDFSAFANLTVVNLEGNNLSEFPAGIDKLRGLIQLDISENNITYIPLTVTSLPELSALFVSFNHLTEIPKALADMPKLSVLDISMNRIDLVKDSEIISALSAKLGEEAFMHKMQFSDLTAEVTLDQESRKPVLHFGGAVDVNTLEGNMKVESISIERTVVGGTSSTFVTLTSDDLAKMQYTDYEAEKGKDYEYTITAKLTGTYLGSKRIEYETTAIADTTALEDTFVFELNPTTITIGAIAGVALILLIAVIVRTSKKRRNK